MVYASGKLGINADLAATTNTPLYTCPASTTATANVLICNRNASPVTVRLSIGASSPGNADYIEFGTTIPVNGVLERTMLAVGAGEVISVYSSATGVSARVHGFERSA